MKQLEQSLREAKQSDHQHARNDNGNARLAHENRVRGDLLCVLGIDRATQDRFITAAPLSNALFSQDATEAINGDTHSTSISKGFRLHPTSVSTPSGDAGVYEHSVGSVNTVQASSTGSPVQNAHAMAHSPDVSELLGPSSNTQTLLESLTLQLIPPEHELCATCSTTSTPSSLNRDSSDSTTACNIAFSMILSNNKRDYKLTDLESRMRAGYQSAMAPGEECRVLNKVLFEVLAEIT